MVAGRATQVNLDTATDLSHTFSASRFTVRHYGCSVGQMVRLSLIIPTVDRPEQLCALLETLFHQTVQDFETIIVDQSEQENVAAKSIAQASGGRVCYLREKRKSLPNARNVAAAAATADILLFIDDDVTLDSNFVEAHLTRLADPAVDSVAGRITGGYDDGAPNAKIVGHVSTWTGTVTRNFHVNFDVENIDQLPGGNFSVRKGVFHALGGFDAEAFGGPASIGEETDFAFRLQRAGKRIVFEPRAHLVHLHLPRGGCRDTSVVRWTFWHGHNMAVLQRRYHAPYTWPVFFAVQTARYAVHALRKLNPAIVFSGYWGTACGFFARGKSQKRPTH